MKNDAQYFINNYQGKPVKFVLAGCGFTFADLLSIPGASRVIEAIYMPYSNEVLSAEYGFGDKAFSKESAHRLASKMSWDTVVVGITGAITTNRYRKGDNGAWVVVRYGNRMSEFYISLPKLTEQEYGGLSEKDVLYRRISDDRVIFEAVINHLMQEYSY